MIEGLIRELTKKDCPIIAIAFAKEGKIFKCLVSAPTRPFSPHWARAS